MLKIYLARHGQNVDNVNGVLNGHRDEPLTKLGEEQAQQTAHHIAAKNLQFDYVYTSPLIRASKTAEIITDNLGLQKPEILLGLIERDFGIMSGKPTADIVPLCAPEIIETETITYFLSPPEAETFPDLIKRANKVLSFIAERHSDGSVLLVGHGDMGKMIYAAYYDLDWKDVLINFHFGNGELLLLSPDSLPTEAHVFTQEQVNH